MPAISQRIKITGEKLRLFPLSDIHIGSKAFDEKTFLHYRNWIRDHDDTYAFLGGDVVEGPNPHDKWDLALKPDEQIDKAIELLEPIKKKILGSVMGNHDGVWTLKEVGIDAAKIIAKNLEVPYCKEEMLLRLLLEGREYLVYFVHGASSATSTTGKISYLERIAANIEADAVGIGHVHTIYAQPKLYKVYDSKNKCITTKQKMLFISGSFTREAGYAVRAGMGPERVGCPVLKFFKNETAIHASVL